MSTSNTLTANLAAGNIEHQLTLWDKFLLFADSQKPRHTMWFMIALVFQGVLLLPVPAVLMFYYDASTTVLAISLVCFFTNIIVNMGGEGIRTTLFCFAASTLIHMVMILGYII